MGIVSVPTGNDYSRMTAEIINASWQQALDKVAALDSKIAGVESWLAGNIIPAVTTTTVGATSAALPTIVSSTAATAPSALSPTSVSDPSDVTAPVVATPASVAAPVVIEPDVFIPSSIDTSQILSEFETEYLQLIDLLATKFTAFIQQYFPNDVAHYAATTDWLMDALSGGGLSASTKAQLAADDHARIIADANRASAALVHKFSAMRFPLMPDQLVSGQLQIEQSKQNLMAESSRKITMQEIEMLKMVIDKSLSLRSLAMTSTIEYIKALTSAPDIASKVIGIGYDIQTKLISAATGWYNARIEVEKLSSNVSEFNASTGVDVGKFNAGITVDAGKFNVSAGTDIDKFNTTVGFEAGKFNTTATVGVEQFNASTEADVDKFNVTSASDVGKFNAATATDVSKVNAANDLAATMADHQADLEIVKETVRVMLTEIQLLAQMATSWSNNLHASAGVSASDSNTHSY